MRQGNARVTGDAIGCRDPRHYLKWYAMGFECFDLFAAATEYERVATLETQDLFALARQTHQGGVDFVLRQGVPATLFTDVDAFGRRVDKIDNRRRHQIVE